MDLINLILARITANDMTALVYNHAWLVLFKFINHLYLSKIQEWLMQAYGAYTLNKNGFLPCMLVGVLGTRRAFPGWAANFLSYLNVDSDTIAAVHAALGRKDVKELQLALAPLIPQAKSTQEVLGDYEKEFDDLNNRKSDIQEGAQMVEHTLQAVFNVGLESCGNLMMVALVGFFWVYPCVLFVGCHPNSPRGSCEHVGLRWTPPTRGCGRSSGLFIRGLSVLLRDRRVIGCRR